MYNQSYSGASQQCDMTGGCIQYTSACSCGRPEGSWAVVFRFEKLIQALPCVKPGIYIEYFGDGKAGGKMNKRKQEKVENCL